LEKEWKPKLPIALLRKGQREDTRNSSKTGERGLENKMFAFNPHYLTYGWCVGCNPPSVLDDIKPYG